jgi:integrase
LYLGKEAQDILRPWLLRESGAYCFNPREARGCVEVKMREEKTKRQIRDHYTTEVYDRLIRKAAAAAEVKHWSSHRLRHSAATRFRAAHGVEVARVLLGVRSIKVAEIYAEVNTAAAVLALGGEE